MSLQLSDKISGIVEQTERLLDLKQGSYFSRNMGMCYYYFYLFFMLFKAMVVTIKSLKAKIW